MNANNEIDHTAERLRDALGAAADVMLKSQEAADQPALTPYPPARSRPGSSWLVPLTSAAAVVAVVLASVFVVGDIGRQARIRSGSAAGAPPEFYMVVDPAAHGRPLQVHRTSDGAVTDSGRFPGIMVRGEYLTADASDRAFYVASFATCTEATPVTRFYRITINNAGRITGQPTVGSPVSGSIGSLAVSPDGSRMAYTIVSAASCADPQGSQSAPEAIHVMDLSTGAVRTWRNTVTTAGPGWVMNMTGRLSWTADGRAVIVTASVARWASYQADSYDIAVLGLDTTEVGGSLRAASRVLLSQDQSCVTCVTDAIAGPDGSLTVVALQRSGKQARQLVARIWPGIGRPPAVLYSAMAPPAGDPEYTAVSADPSGRWVITWPPDDISNPGWRSLRAGWIRDGGLVSLLGTTPVEPAAIAW